MSINRRQFLKITTTSGVVLAFSSIDFALANDDFSLNQELRWGAQPGIARFRNDGIAKATGQKIYARDFRAKDIPGWPTNERYAFILRSNFCDAIFNGINLSLLGDDLKPV